MIVPKKICWGCWVEAQRPTVPAGMALMLGAAIGRQAPNDPPNTCDKHQKHYQEATEEIRRAITEEEACP